VLKDKNQEAANLLHNALQDQVIELLTRPWVFDPPPPQPWWKRLRRFLHPIRLFKDWLHRDCWYD